VHCISNLAETVSTANFSLTVEVKMFAEFGTFYEEHKSLGKFFISFIIMCLTYDLILNLGHLPRMSSSIVYSVSGRQYLSKFPLAEALKTP
jgi:hypothetical protein